MFQPVIHETTTVSNIAIAYNKDYFLGDPSHPVYACSLQAIYSDATPATIVIPSASISGNIFTHTNHGFSTGTVGQFTTDGALPTPLMTSADYYIIFRTVNTFSVAASLEDAQAGTAITLSDSGTGNQTFIPNVLNGVVVKLQASNDGENYADITDKNVTISADGNILWDLGNVNFRFLRVSETPSVGTINLTLIFNGTNSF